MKIISPVAKKHGRLEIIPLIDIMFFLLASFMMVSLQMQHIRTVRINLPTATQAKSTAKPDMANLTVNRYGQVALDERAITFPELEVHLKQKTAGNANYPVYITGSKETPHAAMIYVLDFARRAGAQKVAFSVKLAESK
jgi:biopolymer transport protein ExbD